MATKRPSPKKKPTKKNITSTTRGWRASIRSRLNAYILRRPHRSFRLTRRRDYVRSLKLPGYFAFTAQVARSMWEQKRVLGYLLALYTVLSALFVTSLSQTTYQQLLESIDQSANTNGVLIDGVTRASLIVSTVANGALVSDSGDVQQVYATVLLLILFLVTIWLLRAHASGNKAKLRDALYSAGSPLVAVGVIGAVVILQLIPGLLGIIGYQTLLETDLFSTGFIAMLISIAAALLVLVSLYFVTSTMFALIIATLPGMYPLQALRTAGDLVIGRRLRVLYRLAWLVVLLAVGWAVLLIPFVLGANALQAHVSWLASLPIVPLAVLIAGGATVITSTSYIYLLYRRIVDDDAAPA